MDNIERRKHYLRVYRQQLRRETDAMGYGQKEGYLPEIKSQQLVESAPWLIIPIALVDLGLIGNQV